MSDLKLKRPELVEMVDPAEVHAMIAATDARLSDLERQVAESAAEAQRVEDRARSEGVDAQAATWAMVRLQRFIDGLIEEAERDAAALIEAARLGARARVEEARADAAHLEFADVLERPTRAPRPPRDPAPTHAPEVPIAPQPMPVAPTAAVAPTLNGNGNGNGSGEMAATSVVAPTVIPSVDSASPDQQWAPRLMQGPQQSSATVGTPDVAEPVITVAPDATNATTTSLPPVKSRAPEPTPMPVSVPSAAPGPHTAAVPAAEKRRQIGRAHV
jgi:hypothetical protein